VPPVAARARAAFLTTAFAPAPVTDAYLRMADANFARPHTLRTYRSEGRDLGGVADLDPSPLQLPILIVQGDGDRLVPPVIAKNLHARAPHAQLVSVPGAGHGLPVSHAALLADAVSEFARAR
jgi:pimeloyl-ACP methyl ester carboxylesterase